MSDVKQWEHDEQRALENEIISLREQVKKLENRLNKDSQEFTILCAKETEKVLREQLAALAEQNEKYREALQKLACLGNGEQYGNSIGNCIAQEALSLREQVEELTKERDELKTVPMKYRRMQFNAELQDEVTQLQKQLAALAEQNEKMREALEVVHAQLVDGKIFTQQVHRRPYWRYSVSEALSIQPDASALNEYRNQVIEECATCCEEHQGSAQTCANAIRGLKK